MPPAMPVMIVLDASRLASAMPTDDVLNRFADSVGNADG